MGSPGCFPKEKTPKGSVGIASEVSQKSERKNSWCLIFQTFYCLQIQAVESRRMRRKTRRKEGIQGIVSFLTKILFFSPSKLFKGIKDHHGKFLFHWLCANHPQNAADSAAQSGGLNPSLPQESMVQIWIIWLSINNTFLLFHFISDVLFIGMKWGCQGPSTVFEVSWEVFCSSLGFCSAWNSRLCWARIECDMRHFFGVQLKSSRVKTRAGEREGKEKEQPHP